MIRVVVFLLAAACGSWVLWPESEISGVTLCVDGQCVDIDTDTPLPPEVDAWGWAEDGSEFFILPHKRAFVLGEDC